MKIQRLGVSALSMAALLLFLVPESGAKKPKLKPTELIEQHLGSLGSPETLANRKSIKAEGTALMEVVTGGTGRLQGPATFLSEGDKLRVSMVFGINEYPGEEVVFNGKKVNTGYTVPGVRSKLCQFLYDFDEVISEGLFGGVLSMNWSLLDVEERRPKLKYEGLKKVDDREYHALRYQRRKGGDAKVTLYFDTETFRHAHTLYRVRISSRIVMGRDAASASQPETWYTLKESFANFQNIENLTLPSLWTLEFTTEIGREGGILRWTTQYTTISKNSTIDPGQFDLDLD